MSLRARLLAATVIVLAISLGIALLVVDAPLGDELLVFGISVVVGIGTALAVSQALLSPVRRLSDVAARLESGDLAAEIDEGAPGELRDVAGTISRIAARLRTQVADVESSRDEVRESVRRLGEALRSTHDLRKMLAVVLETALVAVHGRSGAVYLLSAKRSELYVKVGRHLDPSVADRRIPVGEGLAGWVARERGGILLPATGEAPVPADPEPSAATALAVPLESQSQLLGVLAIYGRLVPEPFRTEDLDIIDSLARQAGVGIENVLLHQEAQRLSITDGLTGIWNYRYFQMRLAQEFERAVRFQRPLSLLMIDIDHFKAVNDRYGHQRADAVLIELANRLHSHTRLQVDTLARYGGEEFILILPETGMDGGRIAADKIREEIANDPFGGPDEVPIQATVSVGYASYPDHGVTPQALLHAADQAMYAAKAAGRNRVVGADGLDGADLAPDPARP